MQAFVIPPTYFIATNPNIYSFTAKGQHTLSCKIWSPFISSCINLIYWDWL